MTMRIGEITALKWTCLASALLVILILWPGPHVGKAETQSAAIDPSAEAIAIGLNADMTKGAAQGGEAIRRGLILAIEEINESGGVLGRPLTLLVQDHRGTPARGVDNIDDFAKMENLVAVVGGLHTPVALAELDSIHRNRIVYLGPWAAGTPIVANGYDPNFVFRVSVRDEYAGGFLIDAARKRGFKRVGLLLWRTSWGRSNEKAMREALAKYGEEPAAVAWFNSGQKNMNQEIDSLANAGAEVIMLVANPTDGLLAVQELARRPEGQRLPIISHWGITGGDFFEWAKDDIARVDLTFLQTFSFLDPPAPELAERVYQTYCDRFGDCRSRGNVVSPVGTAHAYDLVHLLSRAIERAGTIDREQVRRSLESLGPYDGLMRRYDPPFTAKRHDALDASDFRLSRYDRTGAIVPLDQ